MKKTISLGIILFILFPFCSRALNSGDVNGDRTIDIVDALLIAQVYVGLTVSVFYEEEADVDCSGEFDIVDALLVAQYYVGILPYLRCPEPEVPNITIEEPSPAEIAHGSDPGYIFYNRESETITFTIRNTGAAALQLTDDPPVQIIHKGTPHNCVEISQQPAPSIPAGGMTAFTVKYSPDSVLFTEKRTWILIENNDPDIPVFEFCIITNNIGAYNDYFVDYPVIVDHTIAAYDKRTIRYFLLHLSELELNGSMTIAKPAALQKADPETGPTYIGLTEDEYWSISGAKAAHAVWLDKNNKVAWKLTDYNPDDLDGLFADKELFYITSVNFGSFYSVVDHSPSEVYGYMAANSLIGDTILETMYKVFNDLRTTDDKISFLHGASGYGDPDTAYSLYDALTTYADRGAVVCRISRMGCHSMTRIIAGMLRSVNIPGTTTQVGTWFKEGHSSAVWPCVQLVLPHGDDIYSATLYRTPVEKIFVPVSIYSDPAYTDVCGTDPYAIARRHSALRAFAYPADWTISRCCNPQNYDYADCLDYITQEYGSVLTAGEINDRAYNILNNYCQ